jgi:hypothetical protein
LKYLVYGAFAIEVEADDKDDACSEADTILTDMKLDRIFDQFSGDGWWIDRAEQIN